uniref:BHLH domain-containing protein n=1 Tax=Oryza brachyantha TaxID=4533 RepID=J3M7T1_ORYBR
MSCGGAGQSGWLLEYGLEEIQSSDFIYMAGDPAVSSVLLGFDVPRKEDGGQDTSASKKRSRPESSAPPGTKACREKQRRDRLNERFNELSAILEPGKPPKADKVAILSDAARLLGQLRAEAQKLKSSNESLQDSIKSLKVSSSSTRARWLDSHSPEERRADEFERVKCMQAEKSELRDEKTRLKAEREIHPAAAFAQAGGKYVPYATSYPPPAAFWQWIPPTSLDTSKDPVMWPPVA